MNLPKRMFLMLTALFGFAGATMTFAASTSGIGLTLFVEGPVSPVAMVNAPNTFFYVAELGGKIRVLNSNGSLRTQPAINLADPQFSCRWLGQMQTMPMDRLSEGGLLNIALDPNFDTNLTLYFYYTTANTLVLARMKFEPINQEELVPSSCEVVLQLPHATTAHLGGSLGFGRDGSLYLGIGNNHQFCEQYLAPSQASSCSAPSSINNVQFNPNAGLFYGKILRLNIANPTPVTQPQSDTHSVVFPVTRRRCTAFLWKMLLARATNAQKFLPMGCESAQSLTRLCLAMAIALNA